jgi:hypothetical protein
MNTLILTSLYQHAVSLADHDPVLFIIGGLWFVVICWCVYILRWWINADYADPSPQFPDTGPLRTAIMFLLFVSMAKYLEMAFGLKESVLFIASSLVGLVFYYATFIFPKQGSVSGGGYSSMSMPDLGKKTDRTVWMILLLFALPFSVDAQASGYIKILHNVDTFTSWFWSVVSILMTVSLLGWQIYLDERYFWPKFKKNPKAMLHK